MRKDLEHCYYSRMTSFIFVRHGQSEANANGIIADAHPPLTEEGIEQARRTADEIRDLGVTKVVCSPYLRAQQTAETIAGELGIELKDIEILDDLKERGLGVLEAKPREHEGIWYFSVDDAEGIEKRADLYERMKRCLDQLIERAEGEKLLVVGHSVSGFYLLQAVARKGSVDEFDALSMMNNADYVEVEVG